MPVNVLVCRWVGGWREVRNEASIAAYGRCEAFLSLGALQSPQEVDRVAGEQLGIFGDPRTAIAADFDPMGAADRPYRTWNVGDTITIPNYGGGMIAQRVRALTGAEDENGEVTYSPELGDLVLETQERHELALKKMADGSMNGESPVATPVAQTMQAQRTYGGAPMPTATQRGFTVSSGGPFVGEYSGTSDYWRGNDGMSTFTLVSFKLTVPEYNSDGRYTQFELHNVAGDSIDEICASIDLGTVHDAGTYAGVIHNPIVHMDSAWAVYFTGVGMWGGPFNVVATFVGSEDDVVLAWYPQGTL